MDDDVVSLDPPVSRINGAFSSTSLSVVVQDDVISVVPEKTGADKVRTLRMWDTELPADCVEFCPVSGSEYLLICGTYQLREGSDRIGRLSLHLVSDDAAEGDLTPVQLIDSAAILDARWRPTPHADRLVLAVATALGEVEVYGCCDDRLSRLASIDVGCSSARMALCCDWAPAMDRIVVGESSGFVTCIDAVSESTVASWKGHDYEVWSASFDCHSDHLVFSGADDARLRLWDLRLAPREAGGAIVTSNRHEMGVTAIAPCPEDANLLATGSYDEQLLLWDRRAMSAPVAETSLGGGVWRLKWRPADASVSGGSFAAKFLLAAAMHNGFHVVQSGRIVAARDDVGGDYGVSSVCHYKSHSSLAYGCSWMRGPAAAGVVATCSFYDHALHLSHWLLDD